MRLRPLTDDCPKPLLPVGGRPLITFAMDHCLTVGIERFIVNTHHCPAAYDRAFPERSWRGWPILFRHEPLLLDTAGGLKNIEDLLDEEESDPRLQRRHHLRSPPRDGFSKPMPRGKRRSLLP